MAKVTYEDGTVINFEGTPTPQDIEEAYGQVGSQGKKTQSFWGALGAEITPGMHQTNPYLSAIAETAQEVGTAPMHFVNQFLANLPRATGKAGGVEYPEPKTMAGQVLAKGAGVAGALTGAPMRLLAKAPLKIAPRLAGQQFGKRVARGALGGAITGGAYTPSDAGIPILAPKERLGQAGIGAVLGAITGGISKGTSEGVKAYRRFKSPSKAPIQQRISWQKMNVKQRATEKIKELKQVNNEARTVITDNIKTLDKQLQKSAQTGSIEYQKKLPEFFRNNSDAYGQRLDDISDGIKKKFTIGKANKILQDTLNELDEIGLKEGQPRQVINRLAKKYSTTQEVDSLLLDISGKKITSRTVSPESYVNFKEFKTDLGKIQKVLSSQIKGGQRFSSDDIASAILKKNFGEYVSQEVPEFTKLQQAYKPVVQAMKEAGKIFKPYSGEFSPTQGANLLRKSALGKASPQQANLIKILEGGSDFAPGVGKVSAPSQQAGQQLLKSKSALDFQKYLLQQKSQAIQKGIAPRINQLEARKRTVATLLANKQKAQHLRNILLGGGLGVGGLAAYALKRNIYNVFQDVGGGE